jgi:enoyl reductase-like protein
MVNLFNYEELLDASEEEIDKLLKLYPKQEDFILRIRSALRYLQLALNLAMGKVDATNIILKEHLKEAVK